MALKATIFKAELQVADMNRQYYHTHTLTIARHPSENDARLMTRLLVFALHAHDALEFTKGLSTENEPDLWLKSLSDEILLWIELGQPDIKRIRKACSKAQAVYIYCYQQKAAEVWWRQNSENLSRFENLTVVSLQDASADALAGLAEKNMRLQCTIQDDVVWVGNDTGSVSVNLSIWKH